MSKTDKTNLISEIKNSEEINKIKHLMNFDGILSEQKKPVVTSNLEMYKEGADGKIYGIVKENSKYFVKIADKTDNVVVENFDYIGGEVNKKNYMYESYNVASKQLDLKMISLNEAYGVNENKPLVASGSKTNEIMTEEVKAMKSQIDRFKSIMYNSSNIGTYIDESYTPNHPGVPEAPAKATDPVKEGDPFTEKPKHVDKEVTDQQKDNIKEEYKTDDWGLGGQAKATDPEKQGDPFVDNPKNIETEKEEVTEEYKTDDWGLGGQTKATDPEKQGDPFEKKVVSEMTLDDIEMDDEDVPEFGVDDTEMGDDATDLDTLGDETEIEDHIESEEEKLDDIILKLDDIIQALDIVDEPEAEMDDTLDTQTGDTLDVPIEEDYMDDIYGADTLIDVEDDDDDYDDYDTYDSGDSYNATTESEMIGKDGKKYSFGDIVRLVDEDGTTKELQIVDFKKQSLILMPADGRDEEYIATPGVDNIKIIKYANRGARKFNNENKKVVWENTRLIGTKIVNEEGTVLHDFGKHPGYRKKVMTLPTDKHQEKDGHKVWDDEEGLGDKPFGQKIGDSSPFNKPVSKLIADAVVTEMKRKNIPASKAKEITEQVVKGLVEMGVLMPRKKINENTFAQEFERTREEFMNRKPHGMFGFEMVNSEGDWEYGDVTYNPETNQMCWMDVCIDVDPDFTVDNNLEALYDEILMAGYRDSDDEMDEKKNLSEVDEDDYYEFDITKHYLNYLINGDIEGYEDSELEKIQEFERELVELCDGHYTIDFDRNELDVDNFGKCEISGLGADVITIKVHCDKKKA